MTDYDTMRRGLAEAMGWTDLHPEFPGVNGAELRGVNPHGLGRIRTGVPNPLRRADDAEALEAWLVEEGADIEMEHSVDETRISVWLCQPSPVAVLTRDDEPDPVLRRRRALVQAAWAAVQATREAQP